MIQIVVTLHQIGRDKWCCFAKICRVDGPEGELPLAWNHEDGGSLRTSVEDATAWVLNTLPKISIDHSFPDALLDAAPNNMPF